MVLTDSQLTLPNSFLLGLHSPPSLSLRWAVHKLTHWKLESRDGSQLPSVTMVTLKKLSFLSLSFENLIRLQSLRNRSNSKAKELHKVIVVSEASEAGQGASEEEGHRAFTWTSRPTAKATTARSTSRGPSRLFVV